MILLVCLRTFVCEVYLVDTPSMIPAIQPTEVCCVDKFSGGVLMPRRFADIPIVNGFTWIKPLREMDGRNDWGYHRLPGFRTFRNGDVILFHAKKDWKKVLVKRIAKTVKVNGKTCYYVLGDNAGNSTDSRNFGLIPDSLVIGRATYILFSWDNQAKAMGKLRWKRIGHDLSNGHTSSSVSAENGNEQPPVRSFPKQPLLPDRSSSHNFFNFSLSLSPSGSS